MKSDQYLNLCLEQAAQSPLHYRHGCVVVKGGKVIGQGFNDRRSGYDGDGVLKTGVMHNSAAAPAGKNKPDKPDPPSSRSGLNSAAGGGGGHHANAGLSMHSEMMAINSALTSSSTLAANAVSHVRWCFKLSSDSKQNRVLRREAVSAYVQAVCLETFGETLRSPFQQGTGKPRTKTQGDHHHHIPYYHHYEKQGKAVAKHGYGPNKSKGNNKQLQSVESITSCSSDGHVSDDDSGRHKKGMSHSEADGNKPDLGKGKARNKHLIVPRGRPGQSHHAVKDRMKHPKLVGADVYVARLVNDTPPSLSRKMRRALKHRDAKPAGDESSATACSSVSSGLPTPTGSLHDELTCKTAPSNGPKMASDSAKDVRVVAESRPCYRCVCYMHSVGIKRVFWTTNEGKWQVAKVRDLVDHLEGTTMDNADAALGLSTPEVFVTKHEVLRLRELMLSGER